MYYNYTISIKRIVMSKSNNAKGTKRDRLATQWNSIENSLEKIGQNLVALRDYETQHKRAAIRDCKDELTAYIWGKSDENPLEDISKEVATKRKAINDVISTVKAKLL
jgi:hypothetical protein